jgi:predicted secreted protein
MTIATKKIAATALLTWAGLVFGQQISVGPVGPVGKVVQLSASAVVDVQQDWVTVSLSATRDGSDPALLQSQLKTALDAALVEARRAVQPGQLEVRTGQFSLYPRQNRDGKSTGWQGSAELVLEGRDIGRIAALAGKLPTVTLAGVNFSLSREQRSRAEAEMQAQAIERFRARALEIARSFGFSGYSLGEIQVGNQEQGPLPRPRLMAMAPAALMADAPVPMEAGKTAVTVTVSGTVHLK